MVVLEGGWRFLMGEVPLQGSACPYSQDSPVHLLAALCVARAYRGTSLIRNNPSLGPYIRLVPRALWWCWGGGGSYERGSPVKLTLEEDLF